MALQALWAPETQFQNKNGSLLVQGKIYVQYRGRSQLAKTYRDAEGTYLNTNPLLTDNDGRVLCYADDSFSYTAVVCDFYGNELFSFDPIPCGSAEGGGSASAGTAEHWIGWNGASVSVPRDTETRLRMPSGIDNVDYDGGFLRRIASSDTEMVLEEGLYLVNAVIRFQQSSSDLSNEISNVVIHTRDFESANMQEVGATFRDEAGPDSSSDIHTISLTFIRHASVDDVGSDRLKFAVYTPNTWTSCYIQNLQIAKLGSSVNGSGTAELYDPGQYISIENHVISVTGIEPESYATHDEIQSATSAFITSADLPDLSSYATEQWVLDKHYITSADIPDIPEDVVTSGELATVSGEIVNQIPSLQGYATEEYVTEHTSAFVTSADLPDVSDMATETWVSGQGYLKNLFQAEYGVTKFADILDAVYKKKTVYCLIPASWGYPSGRMAFLAYVNVSDPITASNFFEFQYYRSNSTESANDSVFVYQVKPNNVWTTTERVAGNVSDWNARSGRTQILNKPNLSIYATNSGMEEYVTEQTSAFITSADTSLLIAGDNVSITPSGNDYIISAQVPEASGYVTEQEMEDAIQSATSAFITSGDLDDYATKTWVGEQGYLTSVPSEYVTDTEMSEYVTEHTSAFITSADIPPIPENVVTSAELAAVSGAIEQDISDVTSAMTEALADKMDKSSSADFYPRYDNPEGYLTSVPSEYVTESEMSGYVTEHTSAFITSADLPDVSDMATKTWVNDQHYITSADVPAQVEYSAGDNIDITDHVVSVTDTSLLLAGENVSITASGNDYIISAQVPGTSGYVTEQEMNDAIQSATSAFITSADIPPIPEDVVTSGELANVSAEIVNQIPSLDGYATEQYVQNYTSGFITSADVPEYSAGQYIDITNKTISVSPVKSLVAGENVSITASGNDYIISAQIPGTSGYVTEQEMNDSIQSATSAFITSSDLPDVSDMATETWVGEQGYLTSIPSEYVTDTELESELSGKADTSAIPDVSNFVTQEDVDAAVSGKMDATESSAFYPMATNPSGYLVSSDLNGYATESYVISQTSGKQDTLTFGYDESDKINAINGSAIAGGGGGGGHEYSGANGVYVDNVNEVIGLDTSASNAIETVIENSGAWGGDGLPISAGPGIKVGLENGVLMISNDETVLFENSGGTSAFTTSEPISNFERVRFYINSNPLATISEVVVPMMGNNLNKIELSWNDYWKDEGNFNVMNWQSKINNTGMSAFSISATYYMGTNRNNSSDNGQYYPRSGTTEFAPWFYKVVGIGRKSN